MIEKERESMQPRIRAFVDRAVTFQTCPACGGTRLNPTALSSKIQGRNIAECSAMQVSDLAEFVRGVAVMAHADWLVDLGPGAGHDGGQVVFSGTPADLVASGDTLTAQHLRAYLEEA